jgi:Arc/MetJ-type ribon-helix-helix transcriptional regulator
MNMPRPKANLGQPIYVRLPPEADAKVREMAEREDREISEVVRLAVKFFLASKLPAPKSKRAAAA